MALTLVSEPSEFSWSRHPLQFVASSDATGNVRIRQELRLVSDDSLIAQTMNLTLDDNDRVSYDWSKQVTDQVAGEVPELVKLGHKHTKGSLAFYVRFVEVVNGVDGDTLDSSDRFAVFGSQEFFLEQYYYVAIDTAKDYVFLTAKPLEREYSLDQEDVISVLFIRDYASPQLRTKIHFTSGDPIQNDTALNAISKGDIITFDISDRAWEFSAEDAERTISHIEISFLNFTGDTITLKTIGHSFRQSYNYLFANFRGGFDTLFATGEQVRSEEIEGEVYLVHESNGTKKGRARQEPRVDKYSQRSGFKPRSEVRAYVQMREVNQVYQVVKDQQLAGLTLQPTETEQDRDTENLNSFEFSYIFGDGRQDFDTINAIEFIAPEGGGLTLPINQSDVTGLVAALAAKLESSKLVKDIDDTAGAGTTVDVDSCYQLLLQTAYTGTSNVTVTFSNVSNLKLGFAWDFSNVDAKDLIISGLTVSFIADELPDGVSFSSNTLTLPATSQNYKIVGVLNGSTYDCKIEVR